MKYLRITLLLLPLFAACDRSDRLPISEDTLVATLVDVQLAEAALAGLSWPDKDSLTGVYYGQAYARNGVRQEEFTRAMDRLRDDPKRLETVYGRVVERLEELRTAEQ